MPRFHDIVDALKSHEGRFEALDAFADDIQELRDDAHRRGFRQVQASPPAFVTDVDGQNLYFEIYPDRGVVRFKLQPPSSGLSSTMGAAAVGGLLGMAVGAASDSKEGLLGGLLLGILVGSAVGGAASNRSERVLALQFDPTASGWRLYNGPLLKWAKSTIRPPEAA